ncbi:MAG TPA: hypothetical protein VNV44_09190 [Solirubrobacteraceae bacterium]|nr:hypothetical protein [Solirubrobacteraceae bacterium]
MSAVAAPPTTAAPVLVTSSYVLASAEPLGIAGEATVIAAAGENTNTVVSLAPGRGPLVLARPHTPGSGGGTTRIAASATSLAVFQEGYEPGYKGSYGTPSWGVFAASLGAPLQKQTVGCNPVPGLDEGATGGEPPLHEHYTVALDGDVLAYDSYGCVIVRDLASGLQRVIRLQATLDPVLEHRIVGEPTVLAVSGRLVAYRANAVGGEGPAAIAVYDIDTGQELYRVPIPGPEGPGGTSFAFQPDGTLVIARAGACTATVSAPGVPTHALGVPACSVEGLADGRALLVAPGAGHHQTLAWTALAEPVLHPIADLGYEGALMAGASRLNDSNVVFGLQDCETPHIYRATLTEPGRAPVPPASCPLSGGTHATLTRRAMTLPVRCPLGCEAWVTGIHIGSRAALSRGKGANLEEFGEPLLSLAAGRTATLRLSPEDEDPEPGEARLRRLAAHVRHGQRLFLRVDLLVATPSTKDLWRYMGEQESPHGPAPSRVHLVMPLHLSPAAHH